MGRTLELLSTMPERYYRTDKKKVVRANKTILKRSSDSINRSMSFLNPNIAQTNDNEYRANGLKTSQKMAIPALLDQKG